jgi:hypothetical protein
MPFTVWVCKVAFRPGRPFQQSGMDDQRATFDRLDVGIRQHVAVKIDLQQ